MFMKIISGKYKGKVLVGFQIEGTRPTMDRVKESLFATIQNEIPNSIVLDLFSGSGNLGLEALSQGASFAYLVDSSREALKAIHKNITGISDVEVIPMDYRKALQVLHQKEVQVDIIFLDPPYDTSYIEQSILLIEKLSILRENGMIVCESNHLDKIIYPKEYQAVKEKKYGDKYVVILKKSML